MFVNTKGLTAGLTGTLCCGNFHVIRMCDQARRSTHTLTRGMRTSCAASLRRVSGSTGLCVMSLGSTTFMRLLPRVARSGRGSLLIRATKDVPVDI